MQIEAMDYIREIVSNDAEIAAIRDVLDGSLGEDDFFCRRSCDKLKGIGLGTDDLLVLLAHHKSKVKYGYDLSSDNLRRLLKLARRGLTASSRRLFESPFFLTKACWLYEHAPYFYYYDKGRSEDIDSLILGFASRYDSEFMNNDVEPARFSRVQDPRRVLATTFWENKIFDPLLLIQRAIDYNIEGLELSLDFHPFNYTTLLPEEISSLRRGRIKEACLRSGIRIDIHSPIVGPYVPSPDPAIGRQRFFDPARCLQLQHENIEAAKDVGAGAVVVHLIDTSNLKALAGLVEKAGGSNVRVTIENYCQVKEPQTSEVFVDCVSEIFSSLPREAREKNFGITIDVGHYNVDGEDPLLAANRVGTWCVENDVYFRVHATDNYGNLLFSPPAYSADVHGNVSGRGINNAVIIKLLRSLGREFDVVAEQIKPLTEQDIATIHDARSCRIDGSYDTFARRGKKRLSAADPGALIGPGTVKERSYHFLAGLEGTPALREYLVYRRIQNKKHLSVDEARRISQDFMRMPQKLKADLTAYIDDLLLPVQSESGAIHKSELDLICQNISGAIFGTLNNEHLNQIFSEERTYGEGDIICRQNQTGREMYLVKEGGVAVYIDRSPVALLGPGEIFGEISLFYNVKRSATIKCTKGKTRVAVLTRRGLEALFSAGQPYAHDVIYRLYNTLPERLRNMNDKYKAAIGSLGLILQGNVETVQMIEQIGIDTEQGSTGLFPPLSREEAEGIYDEVRTFGSDERVFTEGEHGDGAYLIIEGRAKVVARAAGSGEIVLGQLGEGEVFGEMALIDDKPRSASVITLAPCRLAFMKKEAFNEFIQARSDLAFRLMGFICLSLFRRILRLDGLYSDIKKKLRRP